MAVHSEMYTVLFGAAASGKAHLDPQVLATFKPCLMRCGGLGIDAETVWNEASTAAAARLAVGCVLEVALRVAQHQARHGLALVRPPGHHAEHAQAMGFCYFNSVAVAARRLLDITGVARVAVVDWDVHHGNGTQQIFYEDANVLYISLHRWDDGAFFPGTGAPTEVGKAGAEGTNVNIAWSSGEPLGDAEYAAAFRCIVLPVLREFAPDVVLVSAGFDAASGHPASLGGYEVSPEAFAHMTAELAAHFEGRLAMALEGGYDLQSLADCVEAVCRVLLNESSVTAGAGAHWLPPEVRRKRPLAAAVDSMEALIEAQRPYWRCLAALSRQELELSMEECGDTAAATAAMASLTVKAQSSSDSDSHGAAFAHLQDGNESMDEAS